MALIRVQQKIRRRKFLRRIYQAGLKETLAYDGIYRLIAFKVAVPSAFDRRI